jgi:hypothetical protein
MPTDARLRTASAVFGAVACCAVALASACSSDRGEFDHEPGLLTDDAGAETGACSFRCSPDLKSVLRQCNGGPVETTATCGPDQGCGAGECVDACTSAELSKGSTGCSFWTTPPDDVSYGHGGCYVAMIANTWDRAVTLKAALGSDALDIASSMYTVSRTDGKPVYTQLQGPLPPGEVALIFLSQAEEFVSEDEAFRCPAGVVPAFHGDPISHGTAKSRAFHLEADAPVAAYSIFPYGGAESFYPTATLLLPVSSWDKAYYAVETGRFGMSNVDQLDERLLQIVANEDDTEVSMRPNEAVLQGIGVDPTPKGQPVTWTLSRGEVLQIRQIPLLTGSPITSNKPIGVFGGSPCTYLPGGFGWCDLTQQQISPFSQWGNEYALVPFKPRLVTVTGPGRENVPWMFIGAADGTELTYDPAQPKGAPNKLAAGEVATFITDARVVVKSQDSKHPFYVGLHMTSETYGGGATKGNRVIGDPDFVNVVPSEQFLDRYVFFADYTFPDTSLVVVRRRTATGFAPVTLECAGELTGFEPLGESGEYEYTFVQLTTGTVGQKFGERECGYGRHEAHSDGPFSVTVWGLGEAASYGYAGGMGSRPANDAPPPIVR